MKIARKLLSIVKRIGKLVGIFLKWLPLLLLLCFIIFGIGIIAYRKFPLKKDNVFEEIYYDRTRDDWGMHKAVSSMYISMDLYKYFPSFLNILSPWEYELSNGDPLCTTHYYFNNEITKEEGASVIYYKRSRRVQFLHYLYDPTDVYDYTEIHVYSYDLDTKELSYGSNVPGEMDTFLFDNILTDWFTYNAETSNFSMDDLGEYKDMGRTLTKEEWEQSFYGSNTYPGEWNPETDE